MKPRFAQKPPVGLSWNMNRCIETDGVTIDQQLPNPWVIRGWGHRVV